MSIFIKYNRDTLVFSREGLQEHQADFMLAWLDLGFRYPRTYLMAWLSTTSGTWALDIPNSEQSYFFALNANNPYSDEMHALQDEYGLWNHSLYRSDAVNTWWLDAYPQLVVAPGTDPRGEEELSDAGALLPGATVDEA